MEIYYNNKIIRNGEFLRVSETQIQPKIQLVVNQDDLYTLILHDPDAVGGTHIHWAIINITNNDIKTGDIVIPYKGPAPPTKSGKHRYIFGLYKQNGKNIVEPINERVIEIDNLEDILKVDKPLLNISFISENESGGKKHKRRTNKRRTNKRRTNKKRTNKKRTNKKRTNKIRNTKH